MKSFKRFHFPKRRVLRPRKLPEVYRTLRRAFGHQGWWPGDTPFEVIVGAILTQNTAWTNVEKAIHNLKKAGLLTPHTLQKVSKRRLAQCIRPAGYFNVKAERLKSFVAFLFRDYQGSLSRMFQEEGERLREKLLQVKGIGPETADSILLYAGGNPFFVIDAYTKRIFSRHRLVVPFHSADTGKKARRNFSPPELLELDYGTWQQLFQEGLPRRVALYNDFHAQIVTLGKHFCKTQKPLCSSCPLRKYL